MWLAAGLTGIAALLAHPIWAEADRLLIFTWLPMIVGLAMVPRRRATKKAEEPALPRQRTPEDEPAVRTTA